MALEKFRHMRCGRPEKAHSHAVPPFCLTSPFDFVAVIDQRTQDKSNVPLDKFFTRYVNVVALLFKNCCQVARVDTRNVLKEFPNPLDPLGCPGEATKSGTVPSNNRIFIDKTAAPFNVGDHDAHTAASG